MLTKELPIQQARAWEEYGNVVVFNSNEFASQLRRYGVNDLFDSKLKIRQDNQKYIFNIDGENKFAVNGKIDFSTFINDFYKKIAQEEQRAEQKKAVINISEFEKKTKVEITITETEKDLDMLQDQILKNNTLSEKATNINNVKFKVERLITFFEQEKKLAQSESSWRIFNQKYDRKDKWLRSMHKTEINRRIKELQKIKEQIEWIEKNKDKKYEIQRENNEIKEVKMNDINGLDMKITLKQLSDRIEALGKEAPDFILTRNEIVLERWDTTPHYELIMNNKKDARKIKSALNRINKEYIQLNKLGLTVAKRQALQQDLKRLQEYLEAYTNDPNKPLEAFVPQSGDAFEKLCAIDPDLKSMTKLNKKARKPSNGEANPEYPWGTSTNENQETGANSETNASEKSPNTYETSSFTSAKEAFEKWGVWWVMKHWIDQTNMKPEQKQFRGGVGNLAVMGWIVFVWWNMIYSALKLLTKDWRSEANLWKNLARIGIPSALIFGSQARSGEWPMSILKWGKITENFTNMFSWNKKNEATNTTLTYQSFPWATALFNGLSYWEMKQFLIQDGNKTKINPNKYDELVQLFKTWNKKNEVAASFLESIGKNDNKNIIDLALNGMNISRKDLQDNPNAKFDKAASEAIVRLTSVIWYMDQKWHNKINPEMQHIVDSYIKTGKPRLTEIDERGDVFYKETITTDKTGLQTKIQEISEGNIQREQDLLLAINTFYDYMPNAEKKISLQWNRPAITFETYNNQTKVDVSTKSLSGFSASRFDSYFELFKAANLTNYIKDICKDKKSANPNPFHISNTGNIEFSSPSAFTLDTKILTWGRGGSLKKVSPTLEANKQAYCDYLNSLKFRKQ